ncbi:TPR-like protein [Coprinopsis marcescibilis]|uniref:TPR-like protein n=1 Tax=Coprinopsis marcescibilis TaxID=230819 RepID=A0A5C3KWP7_COPMA|nr:TPR-like protein [Coprinopsis marcescibilis]
MLHKAWKKLHNSSKKVSDRKDGGQIAEGKNFVSAFGDARNISLQDVQMTVVGGNLYHTDNSRTTIYQQAPLHSESYDALQNLPKPRGCSWDPSACCLPGTRSQPLNEVFSWINGGPGDSGEVLVVAAGAGSGKTALAHSVCQTAHKSGQLVACFFFNQMNDQSTATNAIASTIRGLCHVNDQVKRKIGELLEQDETLSSASPTRQFQELILPICQLLPSGRPLVIVFDALDEGYHVGLLKIFRDCVTLLPPTFRIVATTRPEDQIMQYLEKPRHIKRLSCPLTGISSYKDMEKYIRVRLSESSYGRLINAQLVGDLAAKTEGVFLWGMTVMNHLEQSFDPVSELQNIIAGRSDHWLQDEDATQKLDDLYSRVLSKHKWTDSKFVNTYQTVIGAVVALKESLSPVTLASLLAPQSITMSDINRLLSLLRPLLHSFDADNVEQPIRLLHLSVQEFLIKRAPDPYRLDLQRNQVSLSRLALLIIQKEVNPTSISILGYTSGDWDAYHVPRIPELKTNAISDALRYSARFLVEHTVANSSIVVDASHIALLQDVIFSDPLPILELTASMGSVIDIGSLARWLLRGGVKGELYMEKMAQSFYPMSACLENRQRYVEAHALSHEAVSIYRQLIADNPNPHLEQKLAESLRVLSFSLYRLRRHEESVESGQEGVEVSRRLATADPTFEPLLARSLNALGSVFFMMGRFDDSLHIHDQSLAIRRRLASSNPSECQPVLASSLYSYAAGLAMLGRYAAALEIIQEAADIWGQLVKKDPAAFEPELASTLQDQVSILANLGREEELAEAGQEAAQLFERLAASDPDMFEADLGSFLHDFAMALAHVGNTQRAVDTGQKAVAIRRRLAESPDKEGVEERRVDLGHTLHNLSCDLNELKRYFEALDLALESVQVRRGLVEKHPELLEYELDLAWSLYNSADLYRKLRKWDDALKTGQEAIDIRSRVAPNDPGAFERDVAQLFHDISHDFGRECQYEDALDASKKATDICFRLVDLDGFDIRPLLSQSLGASASYYSSLQLHDDALRATQEAVQVLSPSAQEIPGTSD